jgi:threonine synthase
MHSSPWQVRGVLQKIFLNLFYLYTPFEDFINLTLRKLIKKGTVPFFLFFTFLESKEMENLECIFCERKYPLDIFNLFCPVCGEPMLWSSPLKKRAFHLEKEAPLEKFLDFLPLGKIDLNLSLGEGNTPLLKLSRLMKSSSLSPVFIKNEAVNPSASFKDRGTAVAIQKAVSLGMRRIGTVSTGNMAFSTAAYGAKAGLETFVLLKEDCSREKILAAGVHNSVLVKVKGDYGKLFYESFSLGRKYKIYFMNSVDPFRIEGYKITGFEIYFQLQRHAPRFIFVPVSSGGHLTGLVRAFLDLKQNRFIQDFPTFIGVQAQGCAPVAKAYSSGKTKVERIKKAKTICHSISNPNPPGGNIALKLIQENKGMIISVSDGEILEAQRMLAEIEGIFCEPSSATVLAGLLKLSKKLKLKAGDQTVLVITGSGLKTMSVLDTSRINIHQASLPDLENTIRLILQRSRSART